MFAFRDQPPRAYHNAPTTSPEDRIYLVVTYDEKDDAKALGAKWDKTKKQWYAPNAESALVERWGVHARTLTELQGEDRTYGGSDLRIEFQPKSCWCRKIQYAIQKTDRERVRDFVYGRVNRTCETCGVQDVEIDFEMHGRWAFDAETKTQRLVRLMALCGKCNESTHFGTAHFNGRRDEALQHLRDVAQLSENECQLHVDSAYQKLEAVNKTEWKVDLSLLNNNGIKCETAARMNRFFANSKSTSTSNNRSLSGSTPQLKTRHNKKIEQRATTSYAFRSAS